MNFNRQVLKRNCEHCKKEFFIYLDKDGNTTSKQKYCGHFCSNRAKPKNRKKKQEIKIDQLQNTKRIFKSFSLFLNLTYTNVPSENDDIVTLKCQNTFIHVKGSSKYKRTKIIQHISVEELNELKKEVKIIKEINKNKRDSEYLLIASNFSIKQLKNYKGTKPENLFKEYLLLNNLIQGQDFFYQYRIFNYRVDFYFPKINLGIEIDGDYWHANPMKYKETDIIRYPFGKMPAKQVWEKNQLREEKIKEKIKLIRFWESDILSKMFEEKIYTLLESL